MREKSQEVTMQLSLNGAKRIWKPDKFVISRHVRVGEQDNDRN